MGTWEGEESKSEGVRGRKVRRARVRELGVGR